MIILRMTRIVKRPVSDFQWTFILYLSRINGII